MLDKIILYSGFAGATVFLGGLLARFFNHRIEDSPVKDETSHGLIAFGGGIILSALALVLVPKSMEALSLTELLISFFTGAVVFYFVDKAIAQKGGKVATLLAMLMDFVPESIALGAVFAGDMKTATLLAIFIGLQNLPEAFNAYRDLVLSGFKERTVLFIFFFLSFFGIAGALLGFYFLSDLPTVTGHLMIFASGGILYLLFQDVVPESKLENTYITSLPATLGFAVGIIGEKLIG
ncbi:ZIP family metal transporter [Salibacter halophilus]|uniref:Divalent cation transporter n=1 Tax=Salibacter halophilus TaxID=1803916 RepID=A0A6N6M6X6_9FLAO|nr:divalent cation transporter [Salibacter halophilus]KAB1064353.1 divalent cation transporter [Salibacter halophilus]